MNAKKPERRYLLILACAQRKRPDTGLLPAIERYDGVNFRVLQKAKRAGYLSKNLDMLILSAKYGLIKANTPIEKYDLKMTIQRARELQTQVSRNLDAYLVNTEYQEIFVNLGKSYLTVIAISSKMPALHEKIRYASGGIGEKMAQMKNWLCQIQ
jgi:cytoplasmic iron level regulating protein YaaA (DUF328/UPF0246 family)